MCALAYSGSEETMRFQSAKWFQKESEWSAHSPTRHWADGLSTHEEVGSLFFVDEETELINEVGVSRQIG
jgi:hypothetical protein